MEKTVCELFAGVGGFRLGLEKLETDWETVWFSQWEPNKGKQWAHECYVTHWGDFNKDTGRDIGLVEKSSIPNHNLLVGGFPCQDYSVARPLPGSKGINGKKGVLWWQIRDILQIKQPPFVLLENVDRLLKSPATQRGRDFGVMLSCFTSLGYSVEWRVVNAADYGAGQRRRRTFIFAYLNSTKYAKKMKSKNTREILETKGFFAKTFPIQPIPVVNSLKFIFEDLPSISDSFHFEFKNAGFMTENWIYTASVEPVKESPIPLKDLLEHNVDPKYFLNETLEKIKYLKSSKKVQRTSKSGYEYTFSEGAVAFPDSIDLPARTMLTSESSVNRSTHVIQDPDNGKLRILTPVEAERIQGFNDNWTNTGMPEKFRYFCMGNALVVPMITRMGKTLDIIFENE